MFCSLDLNAPFLPTSITRGVTPPQTRPGRPGVRTEAMTRPPSIHPVPVSFSVFASSVLNLLLVTFDYNILDQYLHPIHDFSLAILVLAGSGRCCFNSSHHHKHPKMMMSQQQDPPHISITIAAGSPFQFLSHELIFSILDFLDHDSDSSSRKSFSLVSKSFHFLESIHRKSLRPLRSIHLVNALRRYPSLHFLDLSLCPRVDDDSLASVSLLCNSTLRSINLSRSTFFTRAGLFTLLQSCPHLVDVDLSNATHLTDSAAAALAEAKNLERLRLARCKKISDLGIGCIAVGCRKLTLLSLKWCLGVGDLGVGLIAIKCHLLRSLDLSYLPISDKCLPPILQLQHLEELVLSGCLGIQDDGLATLTQSSNSLKALDLSNCQGISYIGLSSLTNGASCLNQLNLAYGSSVSGDLAGCLQSFSYMQCVKLDGCPVTSSGLKAIGNWCSSLNEISLSKCTGLTDENLPFLIQKHTDLRKLNITCCRKITLASIDLITESCRSLTCLKMETCSLVQKEAFGLIGQRCPWLEELDVTDNEIDDEGLKYIARCSNLTSLKIGICPNITDTGLSYVAHGCSRLRELDLYRTPEITNTGIAAIANCCGDLEMINVAYNGKVTDGSLASLSKCLRLKELEIRGCLRVTSAGLSAIAVGCRRLATLDIKKCCNINDEGIMSLAEYSQNLIQINMSYCAVTDIGFLALGNLSCLQSMTILHLGGLSLNGLVAALLACDGLMKVKLHASFRPLLPRSVLDHMETRGCLLLWRSKPFQDPSPSEDV